MLSKYAPVFIPTLNRDIHFKRCVESLAKCTHVEKTDLFIALDYPAKEEHWEGYRKIERYIQSIKGFKSVNVIKRSINFGAEKNFLEGVKEIYELYDRVIITEDDNEFSPNFLDYINKGLNKFEDDENVLAICGYNYPIKMPETYKYNYYYHKSFSAWGWGSWRDKNLKLLYSPEKILKTIKNRKFIFESIKYYGISKMLIYLDAIKQDKPKYGDGAVTITELKDNKYCVFPTISKVKNIGHDGSGVHCGVNDIYHKQKIDEQKYFDFDEQAVPLCNKEIRNKLKYFFNYSFITVVKYLIKNMFFYLKIFLKNN